MQTTATNNATYFVQAAPVFGVAPRSALVAAPNHSWGPAASQQILGQIVIFIGTNVPGHQASVLCQNVRRTITSSARAMRVAGISSPGPRSFELITTKLGCSTGSSLGLASQNAIA